MSVVIRCAGMPGWWHAGHPMPDYTGMWLVSYDASARSGMGWLWSTNKRDAQLFATVREAHACWTAVNQRVPKRPNDGKPNRPLTMFTIMFEPPEGQS